jgi:hypothetical protein
MAPAIIRKIVQQAVATAKRYGPRDVSAWFEDIAIAKGLHIVRSDARKRKDFRVHAGIENSAAGEEELPVEDMESGSKGLKFCDTSLVQLSFVFSRLEHEKVCTV